MKHAVKTEASPADDASMDAFDEDIETIKYDHVIKLVFDILYKKWYEETKYLSSSKKFENKYYEKIISLGMDVVPILIDTLKESPEHLFVALNKITKQNPVKIEDRGKIKKMTEDWILWWEQNKYAATLFP
jgi:hypothetical protein